VATRKSLSR
ncbi:hypothetical protein VCCP1035_3113B, partial [Vibrio cholerae CP1035(8)]